MTVATAPGARRERRVDFVISNDRHHVAMALPVARDLDRRTGFSCRFLSLCELRGLRTPAVALSGFGVVRLVPRSLRSSPAAGAGAVGGRWARRGAREVVWSLLLGPSLRRALARPPAACVVPNDAAFPYDRLARLLRARRVPFLLLQEGIRFPLPAEADAVAYGTGGAAALAAWGEASAEHFRAAGVARERIHVTGSPRFDELAGRDWRSEGRELAAALDLPARYLLVVSNPIDDQGFCSTREKLELCERFAREIGAALLGRGTGLVVKLHARESRADFQRAAALPPGLDVRIVEEAPLHPLLAAAEAVVVLASTVGLEALLLGKPLAVLEIPGFGFAFDYVPAGAARGLTWSEPMAPQVLALLDDPPSPAATAYLARQLAAGGGSARAVGDLVADLAERGPR